MKRDYTHCIERSLDAVDSEECCESRLSSSLLMNRGEGSSSDQEDNYHHPDYSPSNKKKKVVMMDNIDQQIITNSSNTATGASAVAEQEFYYQSDEHVNNQGELMSIPWSILQGQYLMIQNNLVSNSGMGRVALSIVASEQHDGLFNFEIVEWSILQDEGRSKLDVLSGIIQVNGDCRIGMVYHKKSVFKSLLSGPEQYWKCEEVLVNEFHPISALWKGDNLELRIIVKGNECFFSKR